MREGARAISTLELPVKNGTELVPPAVAKMLIEYRDRKDRWSIHHVLSCGLHIHSPTPKSRCQRTPLSSRGSGQYGKSKVTLLCSSPAQNLEEPRRPQFCRKSRTRNSSSVMCHNRCPGAT